MRIYLVFSLFALALFGCTRAENQEPAGITIDTRAFRKVTAQSLPPENETCYAVDIRGPGIEDTASGTCYGPRGLFAGFAKGGEVISLKVPRGSQRSLRVLLYQRAADADCPDMGAALATGTALTKTYQLAQLTNLELTKEVENIEVNVTFPGASNTIANAAPCTSVGGGTSGTGAWRSLRAVVGAGQAANTDYKLKMKVLSTGVLR